MNSRLLISDLDSTLPHIDAFLVSPTSVKQTLKTLNMKRFFSILMIAVVGFGSGVNADTNANRNNSEVGIDIYPEIVSNELKIDVDDNLANAIVTVSVFNSFGQIVLQETLGLGLNKLNVADLSEGEYVAVVRQNDVYKNKSGFKVI